MPEPSPQGTGATNKFDWVALGFRNRGGRERGSRQNDGRGRGHCGRFGLRRRGRCRSRGLLWGRSAFGSRHFGSKSELVRYTTSGKRDGEVWDIGRLQVVCEREAMASYQLPLLIRGSVRPPHEVACQGWSNQSTIWSGPRQKSGLALPRLRSLWVCRATREGESVGRGRHPVGRGGWLQCFQ